MAKKNLIGSWAFLIGVVLALVVGILEGLDKASLQTPLMSTILIVLGIIVGLFNITGKEAAPFLMSGTVLILASFFGLIITGPMLTIASISILSSTLSALMLIFIPSTIIVAIRNVFNLAKN